MVPSALGYCILIQYLRHAPIQGQTHAATTKEIQGRNPDSIDVGMLLWEIARLRALIVRADQLQRSLGSLAGGPGIILGALGDELEMSPASPKPRGCQGEKAALLNEAALNGINGLGWAQGQTNSAGLGSQGLEAKLQTDERVSDF
jgi:hypothetical protein